MLEVYTSYLIGKAFEKYDLNEKFSFDDIIKDEDLSYMTEEGQRLLREKFIKTIDENKYGIVKLSDSGTKDGIIFKKISKQIKNTNYFANKVY